MLLETTKENKRKEIWTRCTIGKNSKFYHVVQGMGILHSGGGVGGHGCEIYPGDFHDLVISSFPMIVGHIR